MERELTLEEKEQKVKDSKSGTKFSDLEDIIVVYISELDIFGEEKVLYHVDSVIRETGTIINDGLERIFVNAEVNDGTTVSEFMQCFLLLYKRLILPAHAERIFLFLAIRRKMVRLGEVMCLPGDNSHTA